jgi:hypothetical protein
MLTGKVLVTRGVKAEAALCATTSQEVALTGRYTLNSIVWPVAVAALVLHEVISPALGAA